MTLEPRERGASRRWWWWLAAAPALILVAVLYADGHLPAPVPPPTANGGFSGLAVALSHVDSRGRLDWRGLEQDRAALASQADTLAWDCPSTAPERYPTPDDRLAYWLNAFTTLSLQRALELGGPEASHTSAGRFLLGRSWPVGGQRLTLWAVVRRLESTGDPRVLFALACGRTDCPSPDGAPFLAETLDAQLNDAVRRYVREVRHFHIDGKTVRVSALLRQHEVELVEALPQHHGSLLHFVWAFLPDACDETPGCDTRGALDLACGTKLDQCQVVVEP